MYDKFFQDSRKILIVGIGGGFDIYAAMPFYYEFPDKEKLHLCNIHLKPFSNLNKLNYEVINNYHSISAINPYLIKAKIEIERQNYYFPENDLAFFLKKPIWVIAKTGVVNLKEQFQYLIDNLNIDTLFLVDGGFDSIMRGNEKGPGTILEDFATLAAVRNIKVPKKYLMCMGFGTETEEKMNFDELLLRMKDLHPLEWYSLIKDSAYDFYKRAYQSSHSGPSHIHSKVINAIKTHHTSMDYDLPTMGMFGLFEYDEIASANLLIDLISNTNSFQEIVNIYYKFKGIVR